MVFKFDNSNNSNLQSEITCFSRAPRRSTIFLSSLPAHFLENALGSWDALNCDSLSSFIYSSDLNFDCINYIVDARTHTCHRPSRLVKINLCHTYMIISVLKLKKQTFQTFDKCNLIAVSPSLSSHQFIMSSYKRSWIRIKRRYYHAASCHTARRTYVDYNAADIIVQYFIHWRTSQLSHNV